MKKEITKRTQSSEERDLKAQLAMCLAAFYDIAATLNDFAPLVEGLEKRLKLEGTVSSIPIIKEARNE